MKRRILALLVALALVALVVPAAVFAADTDAVSCTVSVFLVSVTVTPGSVAYGTLALGATNNTAKYDATHNPDGMATPQTQTITNTGTVNEDFGIRTSGAVGTIDWTLHATTPNVNIFTHAYSVADTEYTGTETITFTNWSASAASVPVATSVAPAGVKYLELEIGMPTSVTDAGNHTITVTVLATASA